MKRNSILEKIKRAAASNSLIINTVDNTKNDRTKKNEAVSMSWEIAYTANHGR